MKRTAVIFSLLILILVISINYYSLKEEYSYLKEDLNSCIKDSPVNGLDETDFKKLKNYAESRDAEDRLKLADELIRRLPSATRRRRQCKLDSE